MVLSNPLKATTSLRADSGRSAVRFGRRIRIAGKLTTGIRTPLGGMPLRIVERFAPGLRERILARHAAGPPELERRNPNLVGGDVNAGLPDLRGIVARPIARPVPYATPVPGLFLCSASTPPGGGVHGLCGLGAARAALRGPLR